MGSIGAASFGKAHRPTARQLDAIRRCFQMDATPDPRDDKPVPCFYWRACHHISQIEKDGKSVCREHGDRMRGQEYPLRTAREAHRGSQSPINVIEHDLEM
jgi:hypothetical protein